MQKNELKYEVTPDTSLGRSYVDQKTDHTNLFSINENSFIFVVSNSKNIEHLSGNISPHTENIFQLLKENSEKEVFYLKAIENLLKQKEYVNLLYQYNNELITEDEFNEELDKNEDKYLIKTDIDFETNKLRILLNIVSKINYRFSDDDMTEIFSVEPKILSKNLIHYLK